MRPGDKLGVSVSTADTGKRFSEEQSMRIVHEAENLGHIREASPRGFEPLLPA